jgi:DNA topoisomerase-3
LPADGEEANRIVLRGRTGKAVIESLASETKRMQPPLLYDLTELQRHANRLFSFSAQQTLDLAQALYERHKLISYPRTDSRHLSADVATTVPGIVAAISTNYMPQLAAGTGERPSSKRYVDDSKVSDHHAIIPTAVSPEKAHLAEVKSSIFDEYMKLKSSCFRPRKPAPLIGPARFRQEGCSDHDLREDAVWFMAGT